MKKAVRLILVAVLSAVLLLCGCGGAGSAKALSGSYTAEYDLADLINSYLGDQGYSIDKEMNAPFTLDLNKDGSYKLGIDTGSLTEDLSSLFQNEGVSIISDLFGSEGIFGDSLEILAQESGYEDFSSFASDMVDEILGSIESGVISGLGGISEEGTFTVEEDRITLSPKNGEAVEGIINQDNSITITSNIQGQTIVLTFVKTNS
ncbi:MAG: hypothetical protein HUJ73_02550 [Eubacterium sp.]|nr:hypothetical protein [Eubacterium sp.]